MEKATDKVVHRVILFPLTSPMPVTSREKEGVKGAINMICEKCKFVSVCVMNGYTNNEDIAGCRYFGEK